MGVVDINLLFICRGLAKDSSITGWGQGLTIPLSINFWHKPPVSC